MKAGTFPVDLQEADPEADPWEEGLGVARAPETAPSYVPPPTMPAISDLEAAAAVLNEGRKVVLLAGVGALGAREEILATAERLGSPIVKSLPDKAVVPDDHPLTIGGLGLLGTPPSEEAMERPTPCSWWAPTSPTRRTCLRRRGSSRSKLSPPGPATASRWRSLSSATSGPPSRRSSLCSPRRRIANPWSGPRPAWPSGGRRWRRWSPEQDPIQPQYLMRVIDRLAADDAILCTDSGTVATWAARHFDIRGDRQFFLSANLATMAPGLPYAIAAAWAHPDRQCLAFVGDGGFAMLMAEFLTAARYELPIKVFVANNGLLGQILWEQMVLGFPEYGVRFQRPASFAPWAEACGGVGIRVEKPGDLEGAVNEALASSRPALVDVVVNPDEPPMPSKVHYDQAKGFAEAFLRGQPRRATIASTLFRDKLDQLRS